MEKDCKMSGYGSFQGMLKALISGRRFFIWSACHKSDWLWKLCEDAEIEISGYIDSHAADIVRFHDLSVFGPDDILRDKNSFVFIALENVYTDVIDRLSRYGLEEFRDYLYPGYHKTCLLESKQRYMDLYGNEILGDVDGFRVIFLQGGSRLVVGKNCNIDRTVSITLEQNASIVIGDGCTIAEDCEIECSGRSEISIGSESRIGKGAHIRARGDSVLMIGDHFSCAKNLWIRAVWRATCTIGKDCMFSRGVELQCTDGHNYFDLDKSINLNQQKRYRLHIGDHVWAGADCKLLYGADIGDGSIIGMNTFVNKSFSKNVIVAGNPARCVRKNVAWDRDAYPFCNDRKAYEVFDFREEDAVE